jgi:plasmid replication initiation protein
MKKKTTEKPMRLIAKSNKLIEARHNLDIWELRVFTKMLMMIDPKDQSLDYIIPIKEIISDFELSDSQTSYIAIREAADKLLGRKVYIYKHIEGDRWERQATTLIKKYAVPVVKQIDGSFIDAENKDKYIKIGFDEDVRSLIVNYKDSFTRLNLNVLAKLSPKSFRMYELMKQYEDTGFRTMTVDELRDIFDLTGQYKLYANIKQRVIDKAQKDLDKYADITFTYDEIKQGKAVYRLNFHIKSKSGSKTKALSPMATPLLQKDTYGQNESYGEYIEVTDDSLLEELATGIGEEWGVSLNVLGQLCKKYPEERIRQAMDITRHAIKNGKVKDEAAFFVEAVKKGFTNKALEKEKKQASQVADRKLKTQEKKALQAQLEMISEEYNTQINNTIRDITAQNESITQKAIDAVIRENQAYLKVRKINVADLNVEDFRKDKILRGLVIQQIQVQNAPHFADIDGAYQPKILELEKQVKALSD